MLLLQIRGTPSAVQQLLKACVRRLQRAVTCADITAPGIACAIEAAPGTRSPAADDGGSPVRRSSRSMLPAFRPVADEQQEARRSLSHTSDGAPAARASSSRRNVRRRLDFDRCQPCFNQAAGGGRHQDYGGCGRSSAGGGRVGGGTGGNAGGWQRIEQHPYPQRPQAVGHWQPPSPQYVRGTQPAFSCFHPEWQGGSTVSRAGSIASRGAGIGGFGGPAFCCATFSSGGSSEALNPSRPRRRDEEALRGRWMDADAELETQGFSEPQGLQQQQQQQLQRLQQHPHGAAEPQGLQQQPQGFEQPHDSQRQPQSFARPRAPARPQGFQQPQGVLACSGVNPCRSNPAANQVSQQQRQHGVAFGARRCAIRGRWMEADEPVLPTLSGGAASSASGFRSGGPPSAAGCCTPVGRRLAPPPHPSRAGGMQSMLFAADSTPGRWQR